ncbi:penicillin-binding transpeptidase domain-containing protein [Hathewaya massiliensis]|uniref:penicillin-binding transpeptidase domain-containing protein n=1 Tax=Hathewaya massiliensis TaxID=1964382 RepID=UPI0011581861|nr:penicillin-binding transpeptidase domain-containing protein [Hathewaya massiliensis]
MKKKKKPYNRYNSFLICLVIINIAIISKLFYLQVVKGEFYSEKANSNTHKMILKTAPRGQIQDRNGNILATSRQSFMLIFTETEESKKSFYTTIDKVMELLKKNNATIEDDFPLKIDPFRFEFNVSSESSRKWSELRFKKDRGLDEYILEKKFKKKFKGKKLDELKEEEKALIDEELKKVSPEEVFNILATKRYEVCDLVKEDYIKEKWDSIPDKSKIDKKDWEKNTNKKWKELPDDFKVKYLNKKYDLKTIRDYVLIKDKMKMQSFSGYKLVIIANDLKEETAYIFEQLQSDLPGISILKQPIREYPNKELASSVLGYIRKVNSDEKNKYEEKGYDASSDYIGAAGIEEKYEDLLRGTKGQESIETNKYGRKIKTLGEQTPYPGNNIQLTLDRDLQKITEKALDDQMEKLQKLKDRKPSGDKDDADKGNATRAAAVVINVKNGEILALVSRPGYDPNLFTTPGKLSSEEYKKFFSPDLEKFGREYIRKRGLLNLKEFNSKNISSMNAKEKEEFLLNQLFPLAKGIEGNTTIREDTYDIYPKPFYNYATKSLVPPGSIFKPVTAVAGLEEGVISENTVVYDAGPYNKRYKDYKGASWMYNLYRGSHGSQNLTKALADSNNYYMYEIADRLFVKGGIETKQGLNLLAKYAWKLGLGADPEKNPNYSTGIELDESFGQVYNFESGKRTLSVLYMYNLYNYLSQGTASIWGINFKGINIIPNDKEDPKVNEIKKKLTEKIKTQMVNDNKNMKQFQGEIRKSLKELISSSKEFSSKGYTDKDIEGMINSIQSSVNDATGEIKSGTNLYNASIGQGLNQFTPVQLANYVATLVNGGNRYKAHIINKVIDPDGNIIKDYSKNLELIEKANISPETVRSVKKGMQEVTAEGGTAAGIFKDFPIPNGGKTGSATFSNTQNEIGRTAYGNYVGFAPFDNPEIAVSVVMFDGGHGSYAAEVAKIIYEGYFKNKILKQNSNYKFTYPDILGIKKEDNNSDKKVKDSKQENTDANKNQNQNQNQNINNNKKNNNNVNSNNNTNTKTDNESTKEQENKNP